MYCFFSCQLLFLLTSVPRATELDLFFLFFSLEIFFLEFSEDFKLECLGFKTLLFQDSSGSGSGGRSSSWNIPARSPATIRTALEYSILCWFPRTHTHTHTHTANVLLSCPISVFDVSLLPLISLPSMFRCCPSVRPRSLIISWLREFVAGEIVERWMRWGGGKRTERKRSRTNWGDRRTPAMRRETRLEKREGKQKEKGLNIWHG